MCLFGQQRDHQGVAVASEVVDDSEPTRWVLLDRDSAGRASRTFWTAPGRALQYFARFVADELVRISTSNSAFSFPFHIRDMVPFGVRSTVRRGSSLLRLRKWLKTDHFPRIWVWWYAKTAYYGFQSLSPSLSLHQLTMSNTSKNAYVLMCNTLCRYHRTLLQSMSVPTTATRRRYQCLRS